MKLILYTFLLMFFFLNILAGQKKYIVKVTTLDNKVYNGLMFQVRDKDFLVLPYSAHWDFNVKENNISRTKAFDFEIVKNIKVRKRGGVGKGALIGFIAGTTLAGFVGKAISNDKSKDVISRIFISLFVGSAVLGGGTIVGGVVGGSYPHQFEVKKDSISIQSLKTELKKYEWYNEDKDTLNNK